MARGGGDTLEGGKLSIVLVRAFWGIFSVFSRYTYVEGGDSYAARGYHASAEKRKNKRFEHSKQIVFCAEVDQCFLGNYKGRASWVGAFAASFPPPSPFSFSSSLLRARTCSAAAAPPPDPVAFVTLLHRAANCRALVVSEAL